MKSIILFFLFVLLSPVLLAQQPKDTSMILVPVAQLRKAIKANEELKITKEELSILQFSYQVMANRIKLKDSIIADYSIKDSTGKIMRLNLSAQLASTEYKVRMLTVQNRIIHEKLDKQKKLTGWFVGGGTVIGLLIGILVK